jgi:hypothetical protein
MIRQNMLSVIILTDNKGKSLSNEKRLKLFQMYKIEHKTKPSIIL